MVDAAPQPKYRDNLPHVDTDKFCITNSGIETTLIFDYGIMINQFAAWRALEIEGGKKAL